MQYTPRNRPKSKQTIIGAILTASLLSGCVSRAFDGPVELYSVDFVSTKEAPVGFMDYKVYNGKKIMHQWGAEMVARGSLAYGRGGYGGYYQAPSLIYVKWKNMKTFEIHERQIRFLDLYSKSLNNKLIAIIPFSDEIAVFVVNSSLMKNSKCPPGWPRTAQIYKPASPAEWISNIHCSHEIEQVYPTNKIIFKEE